MSGRYPAGSPQRCCVELYDRLCKCKGTGRSAPRWQRKGCLASESLHKGLVPDSKVATPQHFRTLVEQTITAEFSNGAASLVVKSVTDLPAPLEGQPGRKDPFTTILVPAKGQRVGHGMVRLETADGQKFEAFLSPVQAPSSDPEHSFYLECVFA